MSVHIPNHQETAPSSRADSETFRASSDVSSLRQSFPAYPDYTHPLDDEDDVDQVPALPISSTRNTRKLVIDSSVALPPAHPIRRKPLSSTASPIATRYSSGEYLAIVNLPRPDHRYDRSFSVDSPTVYHFPQPPASPMPRLSWESQTKPPPANENANQDNKEESPVPRHSLDSAASDPAVTAGEVKHPSLRDSNPAALQTSATADLSQDDGQTPYDDLLSDQDEDPLSDHIFDGYNSDSSDNSNHNSPNTMSLHVTRKATPPHLTLIPDDTVPTPTHRNTINTPVNTDKPLPKSPTSSRLGTFFGWTSSPSNTETSDKGYSPLPSPFNFSKSTSVADASPVTTIGPHSLLEAPKAQYGSPNSRDYCESYLATPPATAADTGDIEEMEDELKAISAELAASIRREMDLEDLVDRLQTERDNPTTTINKRTSDYFSDSGYSSAKFSEYDQSREEVEKIQRRSEQEKAQLRLELTDKLQDERSKRQEMSEQIKELSTKASQIDLSQTSNADASGRVKELEITCETLRRKLSEERQVKDNFEDLLSALKGELQNASNERDNLRDEIVPQLRARVEGLEGQASELEQMAYESTKMQQEMHNLKSENSDLKQAQTASMDSISEEAGLSGSRLSRSNSLTGPPSSFRLQRAPTSGLTRSKSVKTTESRDQLSERLKDVEEQRNALHRALKNLLERQEHQNRENDKKIRVLEMERDRLMTSSPNKAGFQREVTNLRAEITTLRRRAEEALEQKWQVEKGLGGLKMDLDRSEQEIASLRSLLGEKDILIPPALARSSSGSDTNAAPVTSDSLAAAYQDLQEAYTDSLERIKRLEAGSQDESTQLAMQRLEDALSCALSERDYARDEVTSYKEQLDILKAGEQAYLESERALADELRESARRVEELAVQVRQQLAANQNLRQRIADTVARGEANQKANSEQITTMQSRLRILEEKLEAAQAASEDRVTRHEEEMSTLKESHNAQLTRMREGLRSPRTFPPKSPLSPLFTQGGRSPRLSATRSGPAMNVSEEAQVDNLKARVAELENALTDADSEMQQVVGRMNTAQIEVLELQEEREAAVRQTRRLEKELQAEKLQAFEGRFKSLLA
ncbi:Uu.00g009390.m01.CDS01 [Anthostomella pinea]|uniref:Uu.00g009390.m01.CDS01 n=1 Tax=Anthostomella pinea TaxID=933095 RepID=A0AAI8VY08_9PEZI|nr:Uu.00g009390.m01.CDS01 [Anthostomella pinea]